MIDSFPYLKKDMERVSKWKEKIGWKSEMTGSKG